MKAPTNI